MYDLYSDCMRRELSRLLGLRQLMRIVLHYCCLQLSCRQVAFDHKAILRLAPRPARFSTFCNLFLDAKIEIYPSMLFVFRDLDILQVTLANWYRPSTTTKAIARLD